MSFEISDSSEKTKDVNNTENSEILNAISATQEELTAQKTEIQKNKEEKDKKAEQPIDKEIFKKIFTTLENDLLPKVLQKDENKLLRVNLVHYNRVVYCKDQNPNIEICLYDKVEHKTIRLATISKDAFLDGNVLNKDKFTNQLQIILARHSNIMQKVRLDGVKTAQSNREKQVMIERYKKAINKIEGQDFDFTTLFPTKANDIRYITYFHGGNLTDRDNSMVLQEDTTNKNENIGVFKIKIGTHFTEQRITIPMNNVLGSKRGELDINKFKKEVATQLTNIIEKPNITENMKQNGTKIDKLQYTQLNKMFRYQVLDDLLKDPKTSYVGEYVKNNILKFTDKNPDIGISISDKEIGTIKKDIFLNNTIVKKDAFKNALYDILKKYAATIINKKEKI